MARAPPSHIHALLLTGILLLIPLLSGCLAPPQAPIPGEIRTYQGQHLSSINDFHENSIKGPQYINSTTYRLHIDGLVTTPKTYTISDVIDYHMHLTKVATLNCVEGWSVTILWEGVLVRDLINETAPLPGATTVTMTAYDGYTSSYPLSYFINNSIILAYKMNNVTMPPERGYPFELVAEGKWGYKWIKWVTEIEVSDDVGYRGFWERKGYSNNGDLNQSFYGG